MKKNLTMFLSSVIMAGGSIIPAMAANEVDIEYTLNETPGEAVFHLDTTAIAYDSDNLNKDINYHITTTAGNYFESTDAKVDYAVSTDKTITLSGTHGDNSITVTTDSSAANGKLDLKRTASDEYTYTGKISTTSEKATKADVYLGKATIAFEADKAVAENDIINAYYYAIGGRDNAAVRFDATEQDMFKLTLSNRATTVSGQDGEFYWLMNRYIYGGQNMLLDEFNISKEYVQAYSNNELDSYKGPAIYLNGAKASDLAKDASKVVTVFE